MPGLSSLDQMHLLALADTVSTCNTVFSERFATDSGKNAVAKENMDAMEGEIPSGMELRELKTSSSESVAYLVTHQ